MSVTYEVSYQPKDPWERRVSVVYRDERTAIQLADKARAKGHKDVRVTKVSRG